MKHDPVYREYDIDWILPRLAGAVLVACLAALLFGGCISIAKPPVVTPPPMRAVAVVVTSQGRPVAGGVVTLDDAVAPHVGATNANGYVLFTPVPASLTDSQLRVEAAGFTLYDAHVDVPGGNATLTVTLTAAKPPPPPIDPLDVRANFCNLRDSTGRVIFSSSFAAQAPEMQAEWIAAELAAGGTHYVLSIETGYTAYPPVINFYTAHRMTEWLATLDRVLAARLVPVVFLHSGGPYPGADYLRGVLAQIPRAYYTRVVWVVAWEAVAGDWTSRQFRDGNRLARDLLGSDAILAAHLSPGRLSFSSYPIEPDDPWAGDEMACYRTGWGPDGTAAHPFDVFLYQSSPFRPGMSFDATVSESPAERAKEVADRVLGMDARLDWFAGLPKRPTLIAFETVAFWQIRGVGDAEYAREVADFFQGLGYQGFGNGLPR